MARSSPSPVSELCQITIARLPTTTADGDDDVDDDDDGDDDDDNGEDDSGVSVLADKYRTPTHYYCRWG